MSQNGNNSFMVIIQRQICQFNSTQRALMDADVNSKVLSVRIYITPLCKNYVSHISYTLSPVPVRSAIKSYFTSWFRPGMVPKSSKNSFNHCAYEVIVHISYLRRPKYSLFTTNNCYLPFLRARIQPTLDPYAEAFL